MITYETPSSAAMCVGLCSGGAACQALRDVHFKFNCALLLLSTLLTSVVVFSLLRLSKVGDDFVLAIAVGATKNARKS